MTTARTLPALAVWLARSLPVALASGALLLLMLLTFADVMLRYNFPGNGLSDEALRTLILMVLATGADLRADLAK